MQDKDLYESVLNATKLLSGLLMHGCLESSEENINKTYIKASEAIFDIQHNVYKKMEEQGWYKTETVSASAIQKVAEKHTQAN